MRLNNEQIAAIVEAVADLGASDAEVFLFGSRVSDEARGGDVDLLIETEARLSVLERARVKAALEARLGLPVDLIAVARHGTRTPFERIAQAGAVRLEARP